MVAGHEGDDGDVETVETEDFRVQDDVFGVLVMGAGADVGADFVEDGGDLQEEGIVLVEVVEILKVFQEMLAEFPDVFAVAGIGLEFFRKDTSGAEDFRSEGIGEFAGGQ